MCNRERPASPIHYEVLELERDGRDLCAVDNDLESGFSEEKEAQYAPPAPAQSNLLVTIQWVVAWFCSGVFMNMTLKSLSAPEVGFQFMATLTLSHFVFQTVVLSLGFKYYSDMLGQAPEKKDEDRLGLASIGVFSALNVMLGNMGFAYLSLGSITIMKNLCPLASYIVACFLGVEKLQLPLIVTIVAICLGTSVTVTDTKADFIGVVLLLGSVVSSACRWVQVQKFKGKYSSMQQMMLTQPYAAMTIFPYVLLNEAPKYLSAEPIPSVGYGYIFVSCVLSIGVVLAQFKVTEHTSAVTLNIFGNARGIFLILLGAFFYGEWKDYSLTGWLGILCSVCGVFVYGWLRQKKK